MMVNKYIPRNPAAFVMLATKPHTAQAIYDNTQWPIEDQRVTADPNLAAAVEIVRLNLARLFTAKKLVADRVNKMAENFDPIYERAGLSPDEAMECKLANLQALHHTRGLKRNSSSVELN